MADGRGQSRISGSNHDGARGVTPDSKEAQAGLARILASECFAQAGRSSDFLRFVVEQTLDGAGARLKGYSIGVEVFGRPADFDPQADPLVRVEAGRLRRRLAQYYGGEGAADPIRIRLPRGNYAVTCEYVEPRRAGLASSVAPLAGRRSVPVAWRRAAAALGILLVAAVGVIAWQQRALSEGREALEVLAEPAATEWPRILVLPFENLSRGSPRLGGLAASMTEEVMLVLGQLDLSVIATQAGWYGPAAAMAPPHDYVLTGTVREGGARARITVRLVDAKTSAQLWTKAYDQPLAIERLPDLQEQVAREVAAVAAPYGPIFEAELTRARRSVHLLGLRDCLAKYYEYRRDMGPAPFRESLACFQSLTLRESKRAPAWAGLAMLYLDDYGFHFGGSPSADAALLLAREATAAALALDEDYFLGHLALARLQFFDGDARFAATVERVLELEPDSAEVRAYLGIMLAAAGDSERGVELVDEATRLSPNPPGVFNLVYALTALGENRPDEALAAALRIETPNWFVSHLTLAAAAALAGDQALAARARARLLELNPGFEAEAAEFLRRWRYHPGLAAAQIRGLEAAGLDIVVGQP
jgi:adenylate cyclase